ncbi:hypothetical protein H0H93_009690 [Arthromyces matolae]|nr:hypothetical protein H0H93_009690 [Arthromyces matolae]
MRRLLHPRTIRTSLSLRWSIFGCAVATSVGTSLYLRRAIRADSSEDSDQSNTLTIYRLLAQPGSAVTPATTSIWRSADPTVGPLDNIDEEKFVKEELNTLSGQGTIDGNTGIKHFDATSVPSSAPRVDATLTSSSIIASQNTSWTIFSMHEGLRDTDWVNMEMLPISLHSTLLTNLVKVFSKYEYGAEHNDVGSMMEFMEEYDENKLENELQQSFKTTFLDVDRSIVQRPIEMLGSSPKSFVIATLNPALSGSSTLAAVYDRQPRKLRIANTGNLRAVLGRKSLKKDDQQTYTVHVLSDDHTTTTTPGVSRAFGLGPYKWSAEIQERLHRDFGGDTPIPALQTPLTAEPSMKTIDIQPGDFLVMATNGLWKSLTNEEVVGLVGLWLNKKMSSSPYESTHPKDVVKPSELPVLLTADDTVMYKRWGVEKSFLCIDNNASVHLSRNALGGANITWTATMLAHKPPQSRNLRDDISVTVVLFDDDS